MSIFCIGAYSHTLVSCFPSHTTTHGRARTRNVWMSISQSVLFFSLMSSIIPQYLLYFALILVSYDRGSGLYNSMSTLLLKLWLSTFKLSKAELVWQSGVISFIFKVSMLDFVLRISRSGGTPHSVVLYTRAFSGNFFGVALAYFQFDFYVVQLSNINKIEVMFYTE
jgi:hypothetical protein